MRRAQKKKIEPDIEQKIYRSEVRVDFDEINMLPVIRYEHQKVIYDTSFPGY